MKRLNGHDYEQHENAPDSGGWERNTDGTYYGVSAEKDKLPIYEDMPSGTTAICMDTLEVAFYNATTKTWIWVDRG